MRNIERIADLYPDLMHIMARIRNIVHEGMDLTYNQYKMLLTVHEKGQCSLNTLARELNIAMSSASEMVEKLHQLGLVSRLVNENNRRQILIATSTLGDDFIRELSAGIVESYKILLGRLGEEEQERVAEAFETIVNLLGKAADMAGKGSSE